MRSFFKTFFACLLAVIVSSGISILLLIVAVGAMATIMTTSGSKSTSSEKCVLKITLAEPIVDNPAINPFMGINPATFEIKQPLTLLKALNAIEAAKIDPRIDGIYIEPSLGMSVGMATLEEIRDAIIDFKSSGKFVVAYADTYSQSSYYLCSVADKIFLNPMGSVGLTGMASQVMFFKGTLDKLGVQPEIIRHGTFKSAVEPFITTTISDENRLQLESLLGSIWSNIKTNISKQRSISTDSIQVLVDNLQLMDSEAALKSSLVDSIYYKDQVLDYMKSLMGKESVPSVSLSSYGAGVTPNITSTNKIAVVYVEGTIVDGKGAEGEAGSATIAQQLREVREDKDVKAVVLRVNSPGGSVLASEVMWREVELIQKKKPIVVSMGNYAASGGYYISAPADIIVCSPATITGSIGVFSMMFNAEKGLADNLGITSSTVKTGASADLGSIFRPLTTAERNILQKQTDNVYNIFAGKVSEGRNLPIVKVDSLGGGRVWSGIQANENGLADGYGGIKSAISLAADRAGVASDFRVVTIVKDASPFEQFISAALEIKAYGLSSEPIVVECQKMLKQIRMAPMQARMPYTLINE